MGLNFMHKKINTMLLTDEKQQIEEFSESKIQNSKHKTLANTEGVTDNSAIAHPEAIAEEAVLKWKQMTWAFATLLLLSILFNVIQFFYSSEEIVHVVTSIEPRFWGIFAVGFLGQTIKGILGLGYGVTATICLMSLNVPVAAIGSSVNFAKIFASASIAWSYWKAGKINKRLLFKATVIPGIIGAVLGAGALAFLGEKSGETLKPIIATYAIFLGVNILLKAFKKKINKEKVKNIGWIAGVGGFLDSFGGGGWGPLVTSGLIAKGRNPQYVVGSMSLTEFFVTIASSATFFLVIGLKYWQVILALLLGGLIAAPLSVRLAGKLSHRVMFIGIGSMVVFWSVRILWKLFLG
jgi:uncharacterized membrane protein YfcA